MIKKAAHLTLLGIGAISFATAPGAIAPTAVAQPTFSDIQEHWARNCIQQLATREIISGYPDGTFRPLSPVTRAEFAAFVDNAFPNVEPVRDSTRFVDVPPDYWAFERVDSAYRKGFVSGYPDGEFRPAEEIPRLETFVALASGLDYRPDEPPQSILNETYVDAGRIPEYAWEQIAGATEENIVVTPFPNRRWLDPEVKASRGEIAASLCQALPALPSVPSAHVAREGQYADEFGIIEERNEYNLIPTEDIPDLPGEVNATPEAAALKAFGLQQSAERGAAEQEVDVNFIEPYRAIVTLTQTDLGDDSIEDKRYRVEVVREGTPTGRNSWEIVWAGSQQRCQPGRGSQVWTTELCF
jgi:hypothetical protein